MVTYRAGSELEHLCAAHGQTVRQTARAALLARDDEVGEHGAALPDDGGGPGVRRRVLGLG